MTYLCYMKYTYKDIPGYEGIYKINENGDILGCNDKQISGWIKPGGYKKVRLYKNNKRKDFYIHRLVAFVFLPKVEGKNVINHIDNNPSNNHVSNLEWCTQYENMQHAKNNNRLNTIGVGIQHKSTGEIYKSIKQAAQSIGIKQNTLLYQLKRNSKICEFKLSEAR